MTSWFYRTAIVNNLKPTYANAPGLVSSSLTWETIRTLDFGFDLSAFKNRFVANFDWYQRDTKDMIGPAPVMPTVLGTSVPKMNNTSLRTSGWELQLNWRDQIKDFSYQASLSLSDDRTKITDYPTTVKYLNGYYKGKYIGDIYGYSTIGIAKTEKEMKNHLASLPNGGQDAIGTGWAAGDIMYEDINGDGKVDYGDNTVENHGDLIKIGSNAARYRIGANISAQWRGLDFSMFWQGVLKQDYSPGPNFNSTFFGAVRSLWFSVAYKQHMDYFRDDPNHPLGLNLDSYYPRPLFNKKNQQDQTRYLQNAAYMRLKNIQIGYTLPSKWIKPLKINSVRVYASGENLLTITSLSDLFDPEMLWGGYFGSVYPLQKTISFGLSVNL